MTDLLDEDIVQRVNDLGVTPWSGTTYRFTTAQRDPLSGTGARLFGGRWNPRGVFSTVYLAEPLSTSMAEFDRQSRANNTDPIYRLSVPHELHTVAVQDLAGLDLRDDEALRYVGLGTEDLADDDWTACQAIGHAAWFLNMEGVVAPSATGSGHVVAAFENRVPAGRLAVVRSVALNEQTYRQGQLG